VEEITRIAISHVFDKFSSYLL